MKTKKWIYFTLETGILIGVLTTLFCYIICSLWQGNGLSEIELILMSVLPGALIFITIIIVNYLILNPWLLKNYEKENKFLKRRYIILGIFVFSILFHVISDSIIYLVDDSISRDYVEFINSLGSSDVKAIDVYPFSMINFIVTIILGLIGSVISIPFIRRNGKRIFSLKN